MRMEIRRGVMVDSTKALPLRHSFVPGGYAREMTIPAGTLIVGKIHLKPCFNFVMQGQITVLTEDGVKTVTAPAVFTSGAGMKRVGLAHSDTVWTTVHITEETELDALEEELTTDTYEEFAFLDAVERGLIQ